MNDEKSVLAIEIPEAEKIYSFIRAQNKPLELPIEGVPPHQTLPFPRKDPIAITENDVNKFRNLFSLFKPFRFTLKIGWFGNEVLILKPEDPGLFIRMTKAILKTWPEYQYYGGEYNQIEPHVTLGYGNFSDLEDLAGKLENFLPKIILLLVLFVFNEFSSVVLRKSLLRLPLSFFSLYYIINFLKK